MKIIISNNNERKFYILLPSFLIKSKLISKCIYKKSSNNTNNADNDLDIKYEQVHLYIKNIYKHLKKYIKENGHFTLIEIKNANNNIKIIL